MSVAADNENSGLRETNDDRWEEGVNHSAEVVFDSGIEYLVKVCGLSAVGSELVQPALALHVCK